jgi:hypothetical protein
MCSHSFCTEVSVARVDEVENRFARTEKLAGAVLLVLLSWMAAGTTFLVSMHGDIQAIKQNAKDHGGEIVENIANPKGDAQLAANLALAGAQIQVARSENRPSDPRKLQQLQSVIAKAAETHPNVPEAWQAAAQLVSYRYQAMDVPLATQLPDCLDTVVPGRNIDRVTQLDGSVVAEPGFTTSQAPKWMAHVILANCSLNLDDDGTFSRTSVGKFFEEVKKHHPNADFFSIVLSHVRITYSGGKMLPVSEIRYQDCVFEVKQSSGMPSIRSRALTNQLLTANLLDGTILLPSGVQPDA